MAASSLSTLITQTYGAKGDKWLKSLPQLVDRYARVWGLRDLEPLENLTYSYVVAGYQENEQVILKLRPDPRELDREVAALQAFDGFGGVRILDRERGALLLEQAKPGVSLKSYFPNDDLRAMEIACGVMARLGQAPIPPRFPNLEAWLKPLDGDWEVPNLSQVRQLRDQLLKSAPAPVFLHGDLHHDNILSHGKGWVVIDPKGIVGDPAYEIGSLIRNPMPDLLDQPNAADLIVHRIKHCAHHLDLDLQRIRDWCLVQGALCLVWALEDGCNGDYYRRFLRVLEA